MDIERTIYIVIILLLAISASILLYAFLEGSRNNRTLKRVEQIRSNIFTKIIHEFRTPLTIILGLSKQLCDQKDLINNNVAETYLNAIKRQSNYLSELVNQLLDISNLRSGPKTLEWKTGNIVAFINMISETLRIYAKQNDIEIFFFSEESVIETDFVPDYLNKIMHNLIGNAIKYSDDGTRIYVIIELSKKDNKKILIKVVDHGKGISEEDLPHIFELFYQNGSNGKMTGNGIGLTLTKQLVEVIGGTIDVESEQGKGITFTVELPLQISEKEIYPRWIKEKNSKNITAPIKKADTSKMFCTEINENDPRSLILLVEDNKDIAMYVKSIFPEDTYNILYSSNGENALELATEQLPDIVISDIIMPKKSGTELCKEIKSSPLLNHIPIILISAKNREEDVIEGFKCGAEAYLKKPFQPEELKIRVDNIIASRKLLKEKYHRAIFKDDNKVIDIKDENVDVEFVRHATDIIYREIKNPDFTPSMLAEELALSVSQLNKKLNAITGYPSSTYIIQIKLSHAKKLLTTQNKTIGEVATECGIYDVNYFSRVFKKHTGLTPSQFKKLLPTNTDN